ncbi:MAG: MFS transporter [Solirubrobacteraceae bacterium]|nr:MFS transporter [Solirubrobacteraceae bacterium]
MEAGTLSRRVATALRDQPAFGAAFGVWCATLLGFLAIGAVLPVLPRYVKGPVGAGDIAVGVVVGIFALSAVIGRPVAGRLADLHGRRPIVLAGLLLMSLSAALLFVPGGVAWLVLARLVVGIGDGWLFTAAVTWVVDLAPPERRGQTIGLFGIAVWGGLSVGSVIGQTVYDLASYEAVWGLAVLFPLAGAAVALRLRDDHEAVPAEAQPAFRLPRQAIGPGIALSLANIGFGTMLGFVVLHLDARDIAHSATVFTVFAAAVVLTRLLAGSVPDRFGAAPTAAFAFSMEALGLAIIALTQSFPIAVVGALVMGCGFSMLFPALALAVVSRVDERERGVAMGAFTAFFDIGVGVGGPLAGAVAAISGYPEAFWMGAACAGVGGVIATLSSRGATGPAEPAVVTPG